MTSMSRQAIIVLFPVLSTSGILLGDRESNWQQVVTPHNLVARTSEVIGDDGEWLDGNLRTKKGSLFLELEEKRSPRHRGRRSRSASKKRKGTKEEKPKAEEKPTDTPPSDKGETPTKDETPPPESSPEPAEPTSPDTFCGCGYHRKKFCLKCGHDCFVGVEKFCNRGDPEGMERWITRFMACFITSGPLIIPCIYGCSYKCCGFEPITDFSDNLQIAQPDKKLFDPTLEFWRDTFWLALSTMTVELGDFKPRSRKARCCAISQEVFLMYIGRGMFKTLLSFAHLITATIYHVDKCHAACAEPKCGDCMYGLMCGVFCGGSEEEILTFKKTYRRWRLFREMEECDRKTEEDIASEVEDPDALDEDDGQDLQKVPSEVLDAMEDGDDVASRNKESSPSFLDSSSGESGENDKHHKTPAWARKLVDRFLANSMCYATALVNILPLVYGICYKIAWPCSANPANTYATQAAGVAQPAYNVTAGYPWYYGYLDPLYYAIDTGSAVGYGDLTPPSKNQRLLVMSQQLFMLYCGVGVLGECAELAAFLKKRKTKKRFRQAVAKVKMLKSWSKTRDAQGKDATESDDKATTSFGSIASLFSFSGKSEQEQKTTTTTTTTSFKEKATTKEKHMDDPYVFDDWLVKSVNKCPNLCALVSAILIPTVYGVMYHVLFGIIGKMEDHFAGADLDAVICKDFYGGCSVDPYYFSFATTSTVGYGDIYPISWEAKLCVMSQMWLILVCGSSVLVNIRHFLQDLEIFVGYVRELCPCLGRYCCTKKIGDGSGGGGGGDKVGDVVKADDKVDKSGQESSEDSGSDKTGEGRSFIAVKKSSGHAEKPVENPSRVHRFVKMIKRHPIACALFGATFDSLCFGCIYDHSLCGVDRDKDFGFNNYETATENAGSPEGRQDCYDIFRIPIMPLSFANVTIGNDNVLFDRLEPYLFSFGTSSTVGYGYYVPTTGCSKCVVTVQMGMAMLSGLGALHNLKKLLGFCDTVEKVVVGDSDSNQSEGESSGGGSDY